jgi:hypothetical protein
MTTTLVVTPDPTNDPPRMIIQVTYTGQTLASVVRNDPDGTSTPVRLGDPVTLDGSGQAVLLDYESWFESDTTYTATTAAGSISSSTVSLDVATIWLRHPGVPALSLQIDFQGEGDPVRPVVQSVFEPLGRFTPIVVSDGQRKSKRGDITIRTANDGEHGALVALLDDVTPLLLDVPPSKGFGADLVHQYLAIGDLTQKRRVEGYYLDTHRVWTAPYIVVGRPAGGIQSQRTYGTLVNDFATYQDVLTRYATYTTVLTGA